MKRDWKYLCCFLGQNQQGDVFCLSVNGREVTLPAKVDTGNLSSLNPLDVQYFNKMKVVVLGEEGGLYTKDDKLRHSFRTDAVTMYDRLLCSSSLQLFPVLESGGSR